MIGFIRKLTIKVKLISAFMTVAAILFVSLIIAIVFLNRTISISDELVELVVEPLECVTAAQSVMGAIRDKERLVVLEYDHSVQRRLLSELREKATEINSLMAVFAATISTAEGQMHQENLEGYVASYQQMIDDFLGRPQILSELDALNATRALVEQLEPISNGYRRAMFDMTNIRLQVAKNFTDRNKDSAQTTYAMFIALTVFGVSLTVFFGLFFAISISRPILKCAELMTVAANGDFTVRLPSNYGAEVGQLMSSCNTLLIHECNSAVILTETITKLRKSAQEMIGVSTHMADNSFDLKELTNSVSMTTEELSAAMTQSSGTLSTASSYISSVAISIEEINSTLSTVATAAEQTSTRVEEASSLVSSIQNSISKANESVQAVTQVFNSVAKSVDDIDTSISLVSEHSAVAKNKVADADNKAKNTNDIIRRLEAASRQIGKIVNVISDIADQTNMLALNAAIEAAGAGEAGRGFMVVANEVKELAKQTSEATNEIADQIEKMQSNVPEAVNAVAEITAIINSMTEYITSFAAEMNLQGQNSEMITRESSAAAKQMNDISSEINRISENAHSVSQTVIESSKGVNAIAKSTSELVVGTQEIAMNSERASNNMGEISRASSDMAMGLAGISKNIQVINEEASAVQQGAGSTKDASEVLLKLANDLDELMSRYTAS